METGVVYSIRLKTRDNEGYTHFNRLFSNFMDAYRECMEMHSYDVWNEQTFTIFRHRIDYDDLYPVCCIIEPDGSVNLYMNDCLDDEDTTFVLSDTLWQEHEYSAKDYDDIDKYVVHNKREFAIQQMYKALAYKEMAYKLMSEDNTERVQEYIKDAISALDEITKYYNLDIFVLTKLMFEFYEDYITNNNNNK